MRERHTTGSRLDYLDMVKGIGIILVVIGHSTYVSEGTLTWLASFHMPLFFIVSGMLFYHKDTEREGFRAFAGKRFCGMMIPYFWFSLIYIGVDYYYLYAHPEIMNQAFINNVILQAVSLFGISVLWFLPAIFFGELLFYGIRKLCPHWLTGVLAVLFAFVSTAGLTLLGKTVKMEESAFNTWLGDLVMAGLRVLAAVTFLAIGYYTYYFLKKISISRSLEVLLGIGFMALNAAVAFSNGRVDLHFLVFNNNLLYFLGAFAGTMGLVFVCRSIRPFWLLSFLGSHSLIIMLTHLDCQVMSTAIRFAAGMNQFIPRAKDFFFRFHLYLALFIAEMALIFLINRYFYFLIGRRRPVKMSRPGWLKKKKADDKVVRFRKR